MENFKQFYKNHIEMLQRRLNDIYTIPLPEGYKEDSNQSEINVKEELNLLNEFESVYSVIEYQGEPSGQVYEKYKGYLDNTRKRIEILSEEKKVIEEKNAEDIKNIRALLEEFITRQQNTN